MTRQRNGQPLVTHIAQQPRLVDAAALARHRARARLHADGSGAGFLHRMAADEIEERLKDVNRTFTSPAIVTAQPEIWSRIVPGAEIAAPDEVLALRGTSHDLVLHAMALHWADDPVGQIVQCRRALRPDGLFLGVTLGGDTLTELRTALTEAEVAETGGLSPRVAPMADIRQWGALLQRAGLALPVADVVPGDVRYGSLTGLMHDLRAMGETNALIDRHRRPARRSLFDRAATIYADRFGDAEGRLRATFELVFLTGWAPHDSQQKPLRPGSARSRLAEALQASYVNETSNGAPDR
ncbi:MAG: methyltransferase domain-containing protein, partial [Roseicyclus sp.]